jgi:hypothetical protein
VSPLRRRVPEDVARSLRAFGAIVPALDRARTALAASVPSTRLPGRPLAEALLEYEGALDEIAAGMDAWRVPVVEDVWSRCDRSLLEARHLAERVRTQAPAPDGFEGLIGLIGDLLAPLDAFDDAAERFRELRRGRR